MYYTSDSHSHPATLSVIVPTYNERTRLPELLDSILAVFEANRLAGEIVVVDDNSPDGTAEVAEAYASRGPVRVLRRPGKLGLGSAVMDGFAVATGSVLGVIDADLSHPPGMLPYMLQTLGNRRADVVIASRYIPGGGTLKWPIWRLVMSRFACMLARPITPVRDATSGFFLIARDAIRDVQIVSGGFKICLELLIRSSPRVVVEIPYMFTDRTVGASKMNLREASGYLKQLVLLWRYQRAHPQSRPEYYQAPPQRIPATTGSPVAFGASDRR